jgi:branched-chain amino acid transport system substrate-binding protein
MPDTTRRKKMSKRFDRREFIKTMGSVGIAGSAAGFSAVALAQKPPAEVEIGVVYPLSGPTGPMGQNGVRGWNIAVDEINAAGGIKSLGGAKIKTQLRDSESNPKIGLAETEKLVRSNVVAIVGAWNSNVTFPATQIAEEAKVPWITEMAAQDEITRRGFRYTFRVSPEASRQASDMVDFVADMGKRTGKVARTAGVIGTDDAWGKTISKGLHAAFKQANIESVGDIYYPVKAVDLTVEVAGLAAKKPDVWFLTSQLNDAVLITRALHQQKVQALAFITSASGYMDPKYTSLVGNLGSYFLTFSFYDFDLNNEWEQNLDKAIRARYNVPSNHFSSALYGTAYLLRDILEKTGSTDREKIRNALEAADIRSGPVLILSGSGVKFDKNHDNIYAKIVMAQLVGGNWHTVWPLERKRKFDPVWPRPSWAEIEKL